MKNAIRYFYNINPIEIHQINKKYKFKINKRNYIFYPYTRNEYELKEIYKLYIYLKRMGIYCHDIIENKKKEIITIVNEIPYILLRTNIENRNINLDDILYISNIPVNPNEFKNITRNNWYDLWISKIDYIEYQINQFKKKYRLIKESIDYYIGIAENCISLLTMCDLNNQMYTISHNRITQDSTTEEFYNPLNYIIDNRLRDIAEYLKSCILKEDILWIIKKYTYYNKLNNNDIKVFLTRLMYPSLYFDTYESIIEQKLNDKEISKVTNSNEIYEKTIKKIYNYLRSIYDLPEIEWLM